MKTNEVRHQFIKFTFIGGCGFLVDACILYLLHTELELGLVIARFWSFLVAVTVTWLLNRKVTFAENASKRKGAEWFKYTVANSVGAGVNLIVFIILVNLHDVFRQHFIVSLGIASLVALVVNFTLSKNYVYRKMEQKESTR